MKNKKLFIGLLAMSAFLGSCFSFPSVVKVSDIPSSWFEEKRGEGERLVHVTVERADADESGYADGETNLFIVTDNAAIENLAAPYTKVSAAAKQSSPSVQNSILIYNLGLAVFSLPKSQEVIGFSTFCSAPVKSETVTTGVSLNTESTISMGYLKHKIDPEAGDIAIRVILSPPDVDKPPQVLSSTSSSNIQQIVSKSNQYGSSRGTGTPGFIAAPVKEK